MEKVFSTKKGLTPITIFFYVLIFVMVWALFLGDFFGDSVDSLVINNNLTGIEAFGYYFLPVVIFIALIIFILAYLSYGGSG